MKTSRTKIYVNISTLIMELNGDIVHFDILDAENSSTIDHHLYAIKVFDFIVQEDSELQDDDHTFYANLEAFLRENLALPEEYKTSLQPSSIQAFDFEFLAFMEDQKNVKLENIIQDDEMEKTRKLKSSKEEENMQQEIIEEDKEE